MVGLMLPASIGGALANLAVTLSGRVPVNLNFTAGKESIAKAIEQCGIKTILTSRVFLIKAKIEERPGMVFLEDVLKQIAEGAADRHRRGRLAAARAPAAARLSTGSRRKPTTSPR